MVKIPNFLKGDKRYIDLIKYTDLSWDFVYQCCLHLGVIKQITITDQTIEEWYKEFLKSNWSKKDFLKQYEALKSLETYARLDLALWLKTKKMYNEMELKYAIKIELQRLISKGDMLKKAMEKGELLNKEEKEIIRLREAELQVKKYNIAREREIEEVKEKEEKRVREIIKDREKDILQLNESEKLELLNNCIKDKIIIAETTSEINTALKYLHKYANIISQELIKQIACN